MCDKHKLKDKFDPKDFEETIYNIWENKGYFKPNNDKSKKPYTIVIPPPNITGKLHMGHALDETLQDILIRYKRMKGFNTLWIPGTDHAAIATEVKIVEKLRKEGIDKKQLGREKFLDKAWEWKQEYGGTILKQIKRLGCSCDWSRERFTMDEGLSKAVETVFINLYNKDLIYKGEKMINWCPSCNTSISDAEVEYEQESTNLWHIKYKVEDEDLYIIVATTRPETMLGDTAVAVHPNDERYKHLIGKKVILPIVNKQIPIIADEFVEKEFGTGAVKITPAHDPNDYESALRHNLDIINVFDENWKMGDIVSKYKGLDIYEARKLIVKELENIGALVKIEKYEHNVGKCYRCHNKIEPKISKQWFVKMEPLAKPAIEAVRNGKVKFIPERFSKIYYNWLENIKDWCISRQLWWGHRIPAYYCNECNNIMVQSFKPERCSNCNSANITQDEDTLDTWFSSALWPFSTLGWPKQNEDLKYFYPTNTLVTGYDIIFFWVARMIFSAIEHTGEIPFENVFIHGIVRDSQGRKMSKSLGNGIDPIEIIEKYGTDALRVSLVLGISPGNDIRYMPEKLESASNFANKLWNASKFVLNWGEPKLTKLEQLDSLEYEDKWILSKLNNVIKEVTNNLDNFELGIATQKIYEFVWNEFCDWYIEMVKPRLYSDNENVKQTAIYVLNKVLEQSLKLLHPIMPFVTEEIYTKLYNNEESIMISKWPEFNENLQMPEIEEQVEKLKQIIIGIRNIRSSKNIPLSKKSDLIFVTNKYIDMLESSEKLIQRLGYANQIIIKKDKQNVPQNAMSVLLDDIEVYIPFEGLINLKEEKQRLVEEKKKLEFEVERGEKMLMNPGFVSKAPEAKVNEEKEKLVKYKEMLKNVEDRIKEL